MRSEILRGLSRVLPGTSPRKASIAFILTMFYISLSLLVMLLKKPAALPAGEPGH